MTHKRHLREVTVQKNWINTILRRSMKRLGRKTMIKKTRIDVSLSDEETEKRDWTNLNIELLELILRWIVDPLAHLKFGWICHSWRSIRSSRRMRRACPNAHQLPCLIIHSAPRHNCLFLSPFCGSRYTFPLTELFAHRCKGSFDSWLIMDDLSNDNNLYLYNPFSREKIDQPILSSYLSRSRFEQVVCVGREVYAMTKERRLAKLNLGRVLDFRWIDQVPRIQSDPGSEHTYLMEFKGELLLVIARCELKTRPEAGKVLRMLKLDMTIYAWVEAKDMIKDLLLFLGPQGSMAISAMELGVPGGRVYSAGEKSFTEFEVDTGRGNLCCYHGRHFGDPTSTWVLPGFLYRDREPGWWEPLNNLYNMQPILFCKMLVALIWKLRCVI